MSDREKESFQYNGATCKISIKDNALLIESVGADETTKSTLLVPFLEILTVKAVGADDLQYKRTLNFKRKEKLPRIAIKTIKRYKDHRWRLIDVKLKSGNEKLIQEWVGTIQQKLLELEVSRPKFLLVFVNPFGGRGSAENVYNKKVAPIFDEAGIKTKVITTSCRHHAKSFIETNDMSDYDGIIAVGGDGMLNEVVNGLISQTQIKSGICINTQKGEPRNCPQFLRPNLRVAVIPAGSTDCVSYVTQGINDAETSALHIALGDSHPVDVVSLHNADGVFQQFSMSMTGYGYFGDTLRHSENYRWMGPPRYTFVGANVFLRNKSYSGEVHFLPADDTGDPVRSSFCRTPCSVCKEGFSASDDQLFTPLTPSASFENRVLSGDEINGDPNGLVMPKFTGTDENMDHRNGVLTETDDCGIQDNISTDVKFEEDSDKEQDTSPGRVAIQDVVAETEEEIEKIHKEPVSDEKTEHSPPSSSSDPSEESDGAVTKNGIEFTPPTRPESLTLNEGNRNHDLEEWKVIRGEFMSVKGVAMSCACEKSPLGLSPYSHLSDGAIDLIVVRSCSRIEFLRYMISLSGKSDRFDFPFVEVHRVKAFQFIPSTPQLLQSFDKVTTPRSVTPGSNTDCSESVHISLDNLSVKYRKNSEKNKKKQRQRGMKRSQSMGSGRVSTWNSDGEIVSDPNMTVRVHRGLILMFCRGVEEPST